MRKIKFFLILAIEYLLFNENIKGRNKFESNEIKSIIEH